MSRTSRCLWAGALSGGVVGVGLYLALLALLGSDGGWLAGVMSLAAGALAGALVGLSVLERG